MTIEEIKTSHNPEIALILLCCRIYLETAPADSVASFISENNIDWAKVYHLSSVHRIRPVIYRILNRVKPFPNPELLRQLRLYCHSLSAWALKGRVEIDRILRLLNENGVQAKLYKGIDFSEFVYGDVGQREFSDFDVIIDPADIKKLLQTMNAEGYIAPESIFFERFPDQFVRASKDIVLYKSNHSGHIDICIEFHFKPTCNFQGFGKSFEDLLGSDFLDSKRTFNSGDYWKIMSVSNGLTDFYPHIRSVFDLASINKKYGTWSENEVPDSLKIYLSVWEFLSRELLATSTDTRFHCSESTVVGGMLLNDLFIFPKNNGLTLSGFLHYTMLLNHKLTRRIQHLLKIAIHAMTPNANDLKSVNLPFYQLYYFVKPIRLVFKNKKAL